MIVEGIHKYLVNFSGAYTRKEKETPGKESRNLDSSLDSHFWAVRPRKRQRTFPSLSFLTWEMRKVTVCIL